MARERSRWRLGSALLLGSVRPWERELGVERTRDGRWRLRLFAHRDEEGASVPGFVTPPLEPRALARAARAAPFGLSAHELSSLLRGEAVEELDALASALESRDAPG